MHASRKLAHEPRLADARFSCHEDDAALSGDDMLPSEGKCLELARVPGELEGRSTVHERGERNNRVVPGPLPGNLAHADRRRQALQRSLAERACLERATRSGQRHHEFGHEDLTTLGHRAEACGFDDGHAEPVAFLEGRVTRADADADPERWSRLSIVAIHGALHGDRARDGVRRAAIGNHDRVTDRLDFGASCRRDRFAEVSEVSTTYIVGRHVTKFGRELGRADEIGEEHRDQSRSAHETSVSIED